MGIKNNLVAVALVAILAIAGYQHWQMSKLQTTAATLTANNATLGASLKTQSATIDGLKSSIEEVIANAQALATAQADIAVASAAEIDKIDNYRGWLSDAALEDPEDIERRATAAFTDIMLEFAESTGYKNPSH